MRNPTTCVREGKSNDKMQHSTKFFSALYSVKRASVDCLYADGRTDEPKQKLRNTTYLLFSSLDIYCMIDNIKFYRGMRPCQSAQEVCTT